MNGLSGVVMQSRSSTLLVSAKSLCFISWKSHVSEKYFRTSSAAFFKEVVSISMATNNKMFPTALQKYVCMQQWVIHPFSLEKAVLSLERKRAITAFARDYFHWQIDTHLKLEYLCLWDCFETNCSAHEKHGHQCSRVVHWCVFDHFLTPRDVNGTEDWAVSGFGYTGNTC